MTPNTVTNSPIDLKLIHPNPNQPRKFFDPESIHDLKASMAERGLINPIAVVKSTEKEYMIIAGERRFWAACELGWTRIDCRVWPRETSREEVEMLALVENVQRTDLKPLEIASAYLLLTQPPYNMTHDKIAMQVGKTKQAIQQYIAISELPAEVREKTNRFVFLGLRHLLQVCRVKDLKAQLELVQLTGEKEWSVKELTRRVNRLLAKVPKPRLSLRPIPPIPAKDPLAKYWEKLLSSPDFVPDVSWSVEFKTYGDDDGPGAEGWHFFVRPHSENDQEALQVWFNQMATYFRRRNPLSGSVPKSESRIQKEAADIEKGFVELAGKPRLPKTEKEETELKSLAQTGTPKDIYAWIYGQGHPMTSVAPSTWLDSGMHPTEGLEKILDGIRKYQQL